MTVETSSQGNNTNYMAMWRTKEFLKIKRFGNIKQSFQYIPAFLSACEKQNNTRTAWTNLSKMRTVVSNGVGYCQKRLSVLFVIVVRCFSVMVPLCKTSDGLVILSPVTQDGNNQVLELAWALVPVENKDNWIYFLRAMVFYIRFRSGRQAVIISDRNKGIKHAVSDHFPVALSAHCCKHLGDNVDKKWKKTYRNLFWDAAKAKTQAKSNIILNRIRATRPNCASYIEDIPPEQWAVYAFPRPRYGQLCSSAQESQNNIWLEARHMPALLCLHQIWNQCMEKLYERHKLKYKTDKVTDYAWRWIQDGRKQSAEYTVQNSRPFRGIVTTGTGSHHIVDLEAKTCTCHDFQDYEMPCDLAVALCLKQEREPEDFVSPVFTIAEYKATYRSFLQPIDLNVLPAADVKPPESLVQAGRPKIRRKRRKQFNLSK